MNGHVPSEPESDVCKHGFPPSLRHAGILPNAQREKNPDKSTDTMAERSRDGCTTVQEISFGTRGYDCQKNLDQTTQAQITPAQFMRKAATGKNTQVTPSGKTPMDLAMGETRKKFMGAASVNPEQFTSTPTKQNLLNEDIQKLVMKSHLEVPQREDIRRDLAEGMKFVPPDVRAGIM